MRDQAARTRSGLTAKTPRSSAGLDPRNSGSISPHLRGLGGAATGLRFLPRQPARSVLHGRHGSRLRGRGLNFEELRNYLPGDDVRAIDWKVTARTGQPHVRVVTEERDRPTLIVVDQRMSMFFGSQLNMKSVTAAEAAALAAFAILEARRPGGWDCLWRRRVGRLPTALQPAYSRRLSLLSGRSQLRVGGGLPPRQPPCP